MNALPTARPEEVGLSTPRLEALGALLRERIAAGHLPGAVALVARRGRVAWQEAFGRRDPASDEPMRTDAIFRIYSMTKPLVSVGVMMLVEQGRLLLDDPIGRYLPALADLRVAAEGGTVPAASSVTIQDLLRHTSGLTYEFRGTGPVHKAYVEARVARRGQTNADQVAALGVLPLLHQPGTRWEYSRSTDVLGRLIEVVSGQTLGAFLAERICGPLGMADTAFHVPADRQGRLAGAFPRDPDSGAEVAMLEVREKPRFESGGGGMVSTSADYARYVQMLAGGGRLGGVRLLGRKTVELMTADHLGAIPGTPDLLPAGHGFGLGFAVRRDRGIAATPGSAGMFYWSGMAGTTFWVDPVEELTAVLMIQAPGQREHYRALFRDMVYARWPTDPMRWTIGKVAVTKVVELEMTGGSRFLSPQATPEAVREISWLAPHFADEAGKLRLSVHALVIETPAGRRILVDTCLGNDKQGRRIPHWNGRQGRFPDDMAAAGYPVESIDTVLCTHLHVDHVGWNTRLLDGRWVPTFPHARYIFGRQEFAHWSRPEAGDESQRAVFADSVRPILDAGLAELVEADHRLCEEVRLVPSFGHTPGHVSVMVASEGEEAIITGDIAHHPCQLARPHWSSTADSDPRQAEATRHTIFGGLAGRPVLVIGTHFSGPTAGRVARDGEGYRLMVCW